jgi:hypothetical protein
VKPRIAVTRPARLQLLDLKEKDDADEHDGLPRALQQDLARWSASAMTRSRKPLAGSAQPNVDPKRGHHPGRRMTGYGQS